MPLIISLTEVTVVTTMHAVIDIAAAAIDNSAGTQCRKLDKGLMPFVIAS